jgi:hypothetical protein
MRSTQQCTDEDFRAARLQEDGFAEAVVAGAKQLHPRLQAAVAQWRPAGDHNPGGLACGVGIDDLDPIAETDAISHVRIVAVALEPVANVIRST